MKKFKLSFMLGVLVIFLLLSAAAVYAIDVWNEGYRINTETKKVYVGSSQTCYKVTNTSNNSYFIPTKTTAEWDSFASHLPSGVTVGSCFSCGNNVTFTYRGSSVTYGTVSSQGRCWLDRNLGASQVATAYNNSAAYGDLFQWGRLDDNHQSRTSGTTATNSSGDVPGHSNFILEPIDPFDWRDPRNDSLWQGVAGTNNPCPNGWRIPTATEWEDEIESWGSKNPAGAFASPLKLTATGYRDHGIGSLIQVGSNGNYWSSNVNTTRVINLRFYGADAYLNYSGRARGYSVRCIKN